MGNKNTKRFDLSDYLIHFFRAVKIDGDSTPDTPEDMGFGNIFEDTEWPAIFTLRCAIRHSLLLATWSYRNGVRTIYGPRPAVCFTEMPLAAFLESSAAREERGEAMSTYALVFRKSAMFRYGANPVIYGLSDRNAQLPSGNDGKERIIEESLLPTPEQYRYVTFRPDLPRAIDWTHEREWRWPYRKSLDAYEKTLDEFGVVSEITEMPHMDISLDVCKGMGVVVKSKKEVSWVASDILTLVDRGRIDSDHYEFILCAELLTPTTLREPAEVTKAIEGALIDLAPYFATPDEMAADIDKRFSKLATAIAAHPPQEEGKFEEFGRAWLWIVDNTSELARALIKSGRITVSNEGRYLAEIPEFEKGLTLSQLESMISSLAEQVDNEFNVECGYFSVRDSLDMNDVPFYCDDFLDNRHFYNWAKDSDWE
jgi:hypothetical protein